MASVEGVVKCLLIFKCYMESCSKKDLKLVVEQLLKLKFEGNH